MTARGKARRAGTALGASLLAAAFFSCSFNYGEILAEDLADRTPDAVFVGFTHTVVQDNQPILRLSADRAEFHDRKNTVHLYKVEFKELRSGETLARGRADEATLNTDTEDAEFFGAVELRSEEQGVSIRTGRLSWKGEDRVLESPEDQPTTVEKDDGSRIRGSGFRADARRKAFFFGGEVDGVLVRTEEGE